VSPMFEKVQMAPTAIANLFLLLSHVTGQPTIEPLSMANQDATLTTTWSTVISTSTTAPVVQVIETPGPRDEMIDALKDDPIDNILITGVGETSDDITLKEIEQRLLEAHKVKKEPHAISLTPLSVASPNGLLIISASITLLVDTSMPPVTPIMTPLSSKSSKTPKSGSSKGGSSGSTLVKGGEKKRKKKNDEPAEGGEQHEGPGTRSKTPRKSKK